MDTKPKTHTRAAVLGCALIVGAAAASSALAASNHYVIRSWDYPAGSSNRLFIGAAVGDFNDDAVAEIALLKRAHSQIAIVRATFGDEMEAVSGFDVDLTNNQLIAVAACNLHGDNGGDELIVLRNAPSVGEDANLFVYSFGLDQNWSRTQVDKIRIGPGNSVWKGVACADFNGDGKPDIAVAEEDGGLSNVYLYELNSNNLVLKATNSWLGNMPLTSIAAGDLDGDNRAELVVARQASGNDKDFAFFKVDSAWGLQAAGAFNLAGGSTHYPWRGVAVGEFDRNRANGKEVVFYKSVAQHFHYAKYRGATTTPLAIGSSNFDTEASHPWTGMAVGEIVLSNGFDEMALVRQKAGDETLTLVGDEATAFNEKAANMQRGGFVFGAFDQALPVFRTGANVEDELRSKLDVRALKAFLENNHIPAFTFYIADIWNLAGVKPDYTVTTPGREYESMLEFLDLLKSTNSPIKVTALLTTRKATDEKPYVSSLVRDTNYINEAELAPLGMGLDETDLFDLADHNPLRVDREDYEAWFSLLGAIGNKYPNLVGIAFDDFNGDAGVGRYLNPRTLGKMVERVRKFNDKIAFLPVAYHATIDSDDHRVLGDYTDGFLMYTRNDSQEDADLLSPDEINPCECTPTESQAACTARCDARQNMHGAVVLEPEAISGGMGYDVAELGEFRGWLGTPYKFLLQGIYAETVTRSRTMPTPFTVGAQLSSARVNADLNGLTVYTTPDQSSAMGNTVYSRFASWFLVDDYFNQTAIGAQPSGWTISTLGFTTCGVEADPNNAFDRRLKFTDSSTVTAASARKNFTSQNGSLTAEWKFMQFSFRPQTMYLRQGTTDAIKIFADGTGRLYYAESNGSNRLLRTFATDTWYTVKVVANIATRTNDIYVNGTLHAPGVAFSGSTATALDNIYFATSPSIGAGSYIQYIDAVSITK